MTATLDKCGDSWFHDFVLENFGLTPFINTFPDFMAGGAVMITALFIAAGMEVRIRVEPRFTRHIDKRKYWRKKCKIENFDMTVVMSSAIPVLEKFPLDWQFSWARASRCLKNFDRALLDVVDARKFWSQSIKQAFLLNIKHIFSLKMIKIIWLC